jgi:hypothetical protein
MMNAGLGAARSAGGAKTVRYNKIKRERAMPVSPSLIEMINREIQNIPIEDKRWPELAVELNQLRTAIESALAVHDFDRGPADFQRLLNADRA